MATVPWQTAELHTGDLVLVCDLDGPGTWKRAVVDHLDEHGRPYVVSIYPPNTARYLADELVTVLERARDRRRRPAAGDALGDGEGTVIA